MASVRKEIFKILCDKNIFPVGYKGYSWDYIAIVKRYLPTNVQNSVKDIDNSIREALETVDGYVYSDGTNCHSQMQMKKVEVQNKKNPNKYNIEYTVL